MARSFDDVERVLDRHARSLARHVGGLLVDLGEALRTQADRPEPPAAPSPARPARPRPSSTKEDLLREAEALGIRGRSRMAKADLERAIRARRRAADRA